MQLRPPSTETIELFAPGDELDFEGMRMKVIDFNTRVEFGMIVEVR